MTSRIRRWVFSCLLIQAAWTMARGELVLSQFSPTNPIKVMAIGDSITDDDTPGAWRKYLQPLLETNGYPFTFLGRNQSTASGSFTKTRHEGYSGAVVAAPGVLGYSVHGYAGPDVYLQKIVADALTNAVPDLVLVLVGANDIGRGRNPYQVATNDLPNLLDLIFSNAPNANVILAKITSLGNASLNYGAYYTNASIYNAALQVVVNKRRSAGQNVSLADMFSAVDFNTMFNSDHLHPNALGLQAIAQEWLARIQAITVTTNRVTSTLIHGGEVWKYSDTGEDLGTNWSQITYDDSAWASGAARLGYGDPVVLTPISFGPDSNNRYVTTYFRRWFVVPDNAIFTNLNFRVTRVDGAVVWLNGQEAFRSTNMPAGPIGYTNLALGATFRESSYLFYPTNLPVTGLPTGSNLVAVEVHISKAFWPTKGFDLELIGTGNLLPPPSLTIGYLDGNVVLSWPATKSSGYALFATTNLTAGNWNSISAALTNGGQIIATQAPDATTKFFRLQHP